jgi:hypothetical protein
MITKTTLFSWELVDNLQSNGGVTDPLGMSAYVLLLGGGTLTRG